MDGKLIVVGDVHGCRDELRELISVIAPGEADTLVTVGDFASKGPDVVGALEYWRSLGGTGVLGNNDARVLDIAAGRATKPPSQEDLALLARRDIIDWLATLPLWLDLPSFDCAVVHGGFLPGRAIGSHDVRSDREAVMKMRAVRRDEGGAWRYVPRREAQPHDPFWAEIWEGTRTIYGHTPQMSGLPRFDRRAIGIDTGCVYGGRLTAVVIGGESREGDEPPAPFERPINSWRIVSVAAHRAWAQRT